MRLRPGSGLETELLEPRSQCPMAREARWGQQGWHCARGSWGTPSHGCAPSLLSPSQPWHAGAVTLRVPLPCQRGPCSKTQGHKTWALPGARGFHGGMMHAAPAGSPGAVPPGALSPLQVHRGSLRVLGWGQRWQRCDARQEQWWHCGCQGQWPCCGCQAAAVMVP